MDVNLPNVLTVSRILAVPIVCVLFVFDTTYGNWLTLSVYVYACVTDFLDGYLARTWHQLSSFGRMLDPIADKLLVASLLLVLVGIDRIGGIHLLPAIVILCREVLVSGLREYLAQVNVSVPVSRLAKWKTAVQMVALGVLIVGVRGQSLVLDVAYWVGLSGLWAAAALTVVTGYDYLRAGLFHVSIERGDTRVNQTASTEPGEHKPESMNAAETARGSSL